MKRRRREIEEFSVSFLDVICCGFGAIILLLMITKTVEPIVLEKSVIDLDGQVARKKESVNEIRGQTKVLERILTDEQRKLTEELQHLAKVRRELSEILGQFATTEEQADELVTQKSQLARAQQELSDEMERLLGRGFTRQDNTIGGITVDSEYIIFVIDTSGSMYNYAWGAVVRKLEETLNIYPTVKGIQVMNDMGDYMFTRYAGEWITDSPGRRKAIVDRLRTWNPFSNSSPVEGIESAINTFYDPDKKISIYVFGDEYSRGSLEAVIREVDKINREVKPGNRRVRIHGVGFPTQFVVPGSEMTGIRFAALMRLLAEKNGGSFVGLSSLR